MRCADCDGILGECACSRLAECIIGKPCKRHGFVHGWEAEELRKGIEDLISHCEDMKWDSGHSRYDIPVVTVQNLRELLDQVDAQDSLTYLESQKHDACTK